MEVISVKFAQSVKCGIRKHGELLFIKTDDQTYQDLEMVYDEKLNLLKIFNKVEERHVLVPYTNIRYMEAKPIESKRNSTRINKETGSGKE